eukprot:gene12851-15092_t
MYEDGDFIIPAKEEKHVLRNTAQDLYRPSKEVRQIIQSYIGNITNFQSDQDYYAIHVRRGDKIKEARFYNVTDYLSLLETTIKKIEGHTVTKDTTGVNLFVASDDIDTVFPEVQALRPNWHIFRIPENSPHAGQNATIFMTKSIEERFQETAYLMTEIEVLINSKILICTLSSNICTLLQLLRTQPANTLDSLATEQYEDLRTQWKEINKQS